MGSISVTFTARLGLQSINYHVLICYYTFYIFVYVYTYYFTIVLLCLSINQATLSPLYMYLLFSLLPLEGPWFFTFDEISLNNSSLLLLSLSYLIKKCASSSISLAEQFLHKLSFLGMFLSITTTASCKKIFTWLAALKWYVKGPQTRHIFIPENLFQIREISHTNKNGLEKICLISIYLNNLWRIIISHRKCIYFIKIFIHIYKKKDINFIF
jgi:hypothetical protein